MCEVMVFVNFGPQRGTKQREAVIHHSEFIPHLGLDSSLLSSDLPSHTLKATSTGCRLREVPLSQEGWQVPRKRL